MRNWQHLGTQDRRRRQKKQKKNTKNPNTTQDTRHKTPDTTQHKTPNTRRRQTQISPHEAFLEQPLVGTIKIKRLEIQIIDHFIFCCHGHC